MLGELINLNLYSRPLEKTALEICGEQMEKAGQVSEEQREGFIRNEQGILRSHVLHYITQMVNMKIPFDISCRNKQIVDQSEAAHSLNIYAKPTLNQCDDSINNHNERGM